MATAGPESTAPRARLGRSLLLLVVTIAALLVAMSLGGGVPRGFELRTTDDYQVALPMQWEVVADRGDAHQVVDPEADRPMTALLLVLPEAASARSVAEELRAGVVAEGRGGELIDDRAALVPGAESARLVRTRTPLTLTATGEQVLVREVDLIAGIPDGGVIVLKVMGPDDDFDRSTSQLILESMRIVGG